MTFYGSSPDDTYWPAGAKQSFNNACKRRNMYGTIVFAASFLSWNVAWHQVHCNLCAMLPISALLDLPPPFWKFARTIAVWSMRCNSQSLTCCCKSDRSEEMATWIFEHRCYNLSDLHIGPTQNTSSFLINWDTSLRQYPGAMLHTDILTDLSFG